MCQTVELGELHPEVQEALAQLEVVVHIPVVNKSRQNNGGSLIDIHSWHCRLRIGPEPGAAPSVVDERVLASLHVLVGPPGEGLLSRLSLALLDLRPDR